jgi:type II secretory pathway pseudopilin PulG
VAAFTLAEVLAALVFLAILIPVALEGLSIASSVGETAARKGEAAIVAERLLNESIVMTNWNRSAQSGTVRQGPREFMWEMRNEPWTQDPNQNVMRLITVDVKYSVQGRDRTFTLSTLAENDNSGASTSSK